MYSTNLSSKKLKEAQKRSNKEFSKTDYFLILKKQQTPLNESCPIESSRKRIALSKYGKIDLFIS